MKVYSPHPKSRKGTQIMYFTPGTANPETVDFMVRNKEDKLVPRQFKVEFVRGVAEVADNLGKWLVDNKHALKNKPQHRRIALIGEEDDAEGDD